MKLNDEDFDYITDATGRALGFLIASAMFEVMQYLKQPPDLARGPRALALSLAESLEALIDEERFSPEVGVILSAASSGIEARARMVGGDGEIC